MDTKTKIKYRLIIIFKSSTPQRLFNLFINLFERISKRTRLISYPRSASIEFNNYCNLNCPACPTGVHTSLREKRTLGLSEFSQIVKQMSPWVLNMEIGTNGEVTLIPDLGMYIKDAKKNKIFVLADTNFNCDKEVVKKMYNAGIDMLNISLDGASQKIYSKYRVGGSFDIVYKNMSYILFLRRENESRFPLITWQFIVSKLNESELPKAREMAKWLGVDEFRTNATFIPGGDNYFFEENPETVKRISRRFLPQNLKYRINQKTYPLPCYQPFSEIQILCNGDVIPCCRLREKNIITGNILQTPLKEIWNNPVFVYFRKQLKDQRKKPSCSVCLKNMIDYQKQQEIKDEKKSA